MLTINMLFKILLSRGGFFVQVEKNEYGEILLDYERNESYVKKNQMKFLVKKKVPEMKNSLDGLHTRHT